MVPILPRILLWTDKEELTDFFDLDDVNEEFHDVLEELKNTPQLESIDEVKLFNEVYYQATRIVYEHPSPEILPRYVADIKSNLGWNFGAELVMTMVYYLLFLVEKAERPINKFYIQLIRNKLYRSVYWKPFKHCFERLKKENRYLKYTFKPCPYPVNVIRYEYIISWDIITHDFELSSIEQVLDLWEDIDDKYTAANMINNSMLIKYSGAERLKKREELEGFFKQYLNECKYRKKQKDEEIDIQEELRKKNDEIEELRSQLSILEMSNKALKLSNDSMVSDDGVMKSFTLQEIVAYCKRIPDWSDVRSIVSMLNRLLRKDGTEEDHEMVDSIEEEFLNRIKPRFAHQEIVLQKHVGTEIQNVEAGGTGVNNEIKKE